MPGGRGHTLALQPRTTDSHGLQSEELPAVFLVVLLRHACRQEEHTAAGSADKMPRTQQAIGRNWGSAKKIQ